MNDLLTQVITDLLLLTFAAIGAALAYVLRHTIGVARVKKLQEELSTKKELVELAVLYAQQYWAQLDGPGRYQKAVQWLTEQAARFGIKMTEDEMRGLIEASLKELKAEFGAAWKDQKH